MYNVTFKESVEKDLHGSDKEEIRKILAAVRKNIATALRVRGEAFNADSQIYWKQIIEPCSIVYEIFDHEKTIRIDLIGRSAENS